jgi:hypothetical protein
MSGGVAQLKHEVTILPSLLVALGHDTDLLPRRAHRDRWPLQAPLLASSRGTHSIPWLNASYGC